MKTKYPKPKWNWWFYKSYFKWKPNIHIVKELLWKDKFGDPRCELEPRFNIEWLWWGFYLVQGDDDQWEQWLWVHKYCDGDVKKAEETWGWRDYKTKESTWKSKF